MKRRVISFQAVLMAVVAGLLAGCGRGGSEAEAPASFRSDRISMVSRGAGPDIVLIPGLASHRDVWAGVADSLDQEYRLHVVQVRGFAGLAAEANAAGPVSGPVAEEIARYVDEAGLDEPTLIGHSMGGSIAMMVAARHPESVGRVMVVDMHPAVGTLFVAPGATTEELRRAADDFRARILADSAGSPNGLLEQMFAGMTRVDALRPMLLEGVRESDRRVAANAMHELVLADLRPELANIRAPLTVLYVQPADAPLPREEFDRAYREAYANAPHVRLVRIDDSNHFIQFDQPGRFVAEVRAMMARTR